MPLAPGTTLGAYEIVSPLGAGGMGEVYRARDTVLGRDVALKVLPPAFAEDADRVDRLSREARALAALNHPNIAQVYGFEGQKRRRGSFSRDEERKRPPASFLVMELVEGPTLQDAIREASDVRSQKSEVVAWALPIALQIAQALEAAHEAGIVHRDLKPENVKVRADGTVKVLDFGLARVVAGPKGPALQSDGGPDLQVRADSPTVTAPSPTATGMVLGTAAYMAPEQARGQAVDKRADIWAFGVVLFEMLTGERLFRRDTSLDTLTAVLGGEVPWERLPPNLPASIRTLLGRCLERDPRRRLRDIGDARLEIEDAIEGPASDPVTSSRAPAESVGVTRERLTWLIVVVGVAAAAWWLGTMAPTGDPPFSRVRQLTTTVEPERESVISPDGESFAFVRSTGPTTDIFWGRVEGGDAQPILDDQTISEGGPAFSPDGDRLAFHEAEGDGGIWTAGAIGDNPVRLTQAGFNPTWSPDGSQIAYVTERTVSPSNRLTLSELWVVDVESGSTRRLTEHDAMQPTWSPGGDRIAFWATPGAVRDLFTVGLDGGTPVPVTDDIYVDWSPAWAPDGRHLYFASDRGGTMGLWKVAIDESTGLTKAEPEPVRVGGVGQAGWLSLSTDGRRLVYQSHVLTSNPARIALDAARGQLGELELLFEQNGVRAVQSVSPDGQWLALFNRGEPREDLFVSRSDGTGDVRRITDDPYTARRASWSPDGEWLVYYSNRSGAGEIWSIGRDGNDRRQVSDDPDVSYTFVRFPEPGDRIFAIAFLPPPSVTHVFDANAAEPGPPVAVIAPPEGGFHLFDVSPDGRRHVGNWVDRADGNVLAMYDATTGEWHQLLNRPQDASWLPDGRRVIYRRGPDEIWVLDVETGVERMLGSTAVPIDSLLVPSPDGRAIYVSVSSSTSDIWLLERDR